MPLAGYSYRRHTWEGLQSFTGHATAQTLNVAKQIDGVEYWGGATFSLASENSSVAVYMGNHKCKVSIL